MALFEIIFFSFLLLSLQPSESVEICRASCGTVPIRFPFRLNSQPDRCGYPGFNLSCRNETVLKLPFSGDFNVLNIDYMFQNIWINDPDRCAPKHLLQGLNLSGTPFELLYPQRYTFFNCSSVSPTGLREGRKIYCLSGGNFTVVAVPEDRFDSSTSLPTSCSEIATVPVPFSWTGWSDLDRSIRLTWSEPDCMLCEARAGTCMFKRDNGLDVGCSVGFSNGKFLNLQ